MDFKITPESQLKIVNILFTDPILLKEWFQFAACLGPKQIHVSHFDRWNKAQNESNFKLFYDILDVWLSANGSYATTRNLLTCLDRLHAKDCAGAYFEKFIYDKLDL